MTVRLHLNENTAGCSPAVLAALRALTAEDIAQYPDYAAAQADCERWFGVPPGWVQLTNGLDEGIQILAQWAALDRRVPADVLVVEPAFQMYAMFAEAAGASVIAIPPRPNLEFPVDDVLAAISARTRVIYLTDPNNPTGLALPSGAVEAIAMAAPQALVLIDEAYSDFSGRTFIGPTLSRLPNLIVGRTFAKAYGLAGLRVGALVADPATLEPLRRMLPPYSPNVCAVRALSAALQDRRYIDDYVRQSERSRTMIYEFCDRARIEYWRSDANFVLLRVGPDVQSIVQALAGRRVVVRDASSHPGCDGCIRVTAGRIADTTACLTAMEELLAPSHY